MNLEKIFTTLIKSSLSFFIVTDFCGSRTFFSIPTNNICGSRTYFQIYCLWTFLKSRIFFPYSRTFFWINEHFYYSRTRGIFDAKDFQIFFVHNFFIFRTVHHASWLFRGGLVRFWTWMIHLLYFEDLNDDFHSSRIYVTPLK